MDNTELLNYMPDYYQGVYEMEELLKAEGKTLSFMDDDIEKALLNQFISQADEKGVAIFEDEAGIKPDLHDSLETRRNNVLLHLLPPKPLTIRYLNHLMDIMGLKVNASVDHPKRLVLVDANSDDIGMDKVKNIQYLLNISIPANMIYQIRIALQKAQTQREVYLGVANTADTFVTVKANEGQLNFRTKVRTDLYLGVGSNIMSNANAQANKNQIKE